MFNARISATSSRFLALWLVLVAGDAFPSQSVVRARASPGVDAAFRDARDAVQLVGNLTGQYRIAHRMEPLMYHLCQRTDIPEPMTTVM